MIHKNHTTGRSVKTNLQIQFQSDKDIAQPKWMKIEVYFRQILMSLVHRTLSQRFTGEGISCVRAVGSVWSKGNIPVEAHPCIFYGIRKNFSIWINDHAHFISFLTFPKIPKELDWDSFSVFTQKQYIPELHVWCFNMLRSHQSVTRSSSK